MTTNAPHPYEKEVRSLLHRLARDGWTASSVDDGGELVACQCRQDAIDAVLAVDSSHLYVSHPLHGVATLWLILGNDPGELIADYTTKNSAIASVAKGHADQWSAREEQDSPNRE